MKDVQRAKDTTKTCASGFWEGFAIQQATCCLHSSTTPSMYDTIIIGAGMSGLAAGIRLAYYDQRVCMLERHTTIGGLNSFYRLRGRDYDVGLHALTNITPKGTKKGPLARLLRQLRISWDELQISPQIGSEIVFPGVRLRFDNDLELLRREMAREFPRQVDNFETAD